MIKFEFDFSQNFNDNQVIYRLKDYSFECYSPIKSDVAFLIDCLEIEADSQSGIVCGVSGFCAHTMWKKEKLDIPLALKGQLKIQGHFESGTIKRFMENTPVYFDSDSGWVCIGNPCVKNCISVKFTKNTIASLNNNVLIALWIKPEFV